MNKISLIFALVLIIGLSFTGCKSTRKIATVEAGGTKAHDEFSHLYRSRHSSTKL